jgi:hypothetical protein
MVDLRRQNGEGLNKAVTTNGLITMETKSGQKANKRAQKRIKEHKKLQNETFPCDMCPFGHGRHKEGNKRGTRVARMRSIDALINTYHKTHISIFIIISSFKYYQRKKHFLGFISPFWSMVVATSAKTCSHHFNG